MKKERILRWALPAAFLLLCALALFFFSRYARSGGETVALTPIPTDALGWDIYTWEEDGPQPLPAGTAAQTDQTIYLSRRLDPAWEEAGHTYLELEPTWQFSLFLDGTLFYTTTPGSGDRVGEVAFPAEYAGVAGIGEPVRCTLPPGYGGRTLTVAARRADEYPATPSMALTHGELVTRDTVALTNRLGMPAAAFAVAALCLLGLFCCTLFFGKLDRSLLLLALAAACQSLYWLREFDMRFQMRLPLNIPLAAVLPQLFLLLPLAWLISRMGRWRRWCALAAGLLGAAALLRPVWDVPPCPVWLYDALMLACLAVTLVFAALELAGGNRTFSLFFRASALLCAVFLLCCVLSPSLGRYGAAADVPEGQPRWVEITMHIRGRYLFIEGRNTCARAPEPADGGGRFRSAKGPGHGYGLKIMEGVARRYQSELRLEAKDGIFTAQTALLMP